MGRNGTILISKLAASTPKISDAQQAAGLIVGNKFKEEAKAIILSNAPKSPRKNLYNAIDVKQNKRADGYKTTVYVLPQAADYAADVERGTGQKNIYINKNFIEWARSVVGEKFAKTLERRKAANQRYMVRKGNNPRYDTRTGMKFFQIPVARNQEAIYSIYQEQVNQALGRARLK